MNASRRSLSRREALRRAGGALGAALLSGAARQPLAALLSASGAALLHGCRQGGDRLVVYAANPRPLATRLVNAFMEEESIAVDLFSATTGQVLAKVEAERLNPRADVLLLASGLASEWLRREGRLAALDLDRPAWADSEERRGWVDPHGTFVATGAASVGIATRLDWTRGAESWASLLDGSFIGPDERRGRVVMPSPSRSGTSGDFIIQWALQAGDRAWDLLISARRKAILEVKGANSEALTSLETNESQAILAAVDYLVCDRVAAGHPMRLSFPESGAPIVTRPICILRSTRRLESAQRFVRFLLSPRAQAMIAAANMLPADPSIPLSPVRAAAGIPRPMPIDLDQALAEQRQILRRFQYEVERLVVIS
ncbi:MAG: substrate-binding domain-containing protein [Phycisphaeraceae bacterium]|nr:substrate-binding domain-containing protein [Phycisphaeraceae bacterium]